MEGKEIKHIVAFKASSLRPNEEVQFFLEGWIGEMMGKGDDAQHNGAFILTNKRAIFYRKGILGEVLETIPLDKVTSVETMSRMGYRLLRLHTSHDELAFKTFEAKPLFDSVYERIEELRHEGGDGAAVATVQTDDPMAQLERLGKLRDAGVVTDEEFEAKKAELLARI